MIVHPTPRIIEACLSDRWIKKFLLIIFFASFCQLSFAQERKREIDSLLNVLKTAAEDTNKVNTLNALGSWLSETSRYEEARTYVNDALVLAEKLSFKKGTATAYYYTGNIYNHHGNYPEAIKNYLAALKIYKIIVDKKGIAATYIRIGLIYWHDGNYPEALKNHQTALKIYEEIGDKLGIADSYNKIGTIYRNQGNYAEALKNFLSSLKIMEETGYKVGIALTYNNIGIIYWHQENYPEALKNYLASLKVWEEIGDKRGIASCYNNLSIIYGKQANYPEALKNGMASLKYNEEIGFKYGVASSYDNIGEIYRYQGNYPDALKNYLAALKNVEEIGDKHGIAICYHNIGKVCIELCKYPEAKQYLMNGLSLSKEIGVKENIRDGYYALSKLDSAIGNYQQALVNYKLYTDYKDSLLNETNSKQIAGMKEQYESEKKDKEILELNIDKQKLENEKRVTASEKEKIRLEKEKTDALNLYNQQQLALLAKDKRLQELQIEKKEADLLVQKAETEKRQSDYLVQKAVADRKEEQLTVLNKEKAIQNLQLKKQKQAKNYFIAALILFTILSFFIYRNYRTRQKLKLQTLRNKIALDLHDDVGSTLSSISIFSQMAQQQSKETIPLLETIGESSRKMLDAMADIVWTINPENDQFEKIISRMKSFAFELLGAKHIDFEFVADEHVANMKLPMEVRKNLYLIFKEATNNMVKYAQANKAMFAIKGGTNDLTMMIRDNGRGFDINKSTEGNGLKNMKKRAEEIGGHLMIDSLPGNGTTIQLRVTI